jgi:hypothetical protein
MAFSTSFSSYMVFSSTLEANSKEKSPLLGYLFLGSICYRHYPSLLEKGRFQVFSLRYNHTLHTFEIRLDFLDPWNMMALGTGWGLES